MVDEWAAIIEELNAAQDELNELERSYLDIERAIGEALGAYESYITASTIKRARIHRLLNRLGQAGVLSDSI